MGDFGPPVTHQCSLDIVLGLTSIGGFTLNPQMRDFGGFFWGYKRLYVFVYRERQILSMLI